jgi:tetratricopeptide (TPR) repeat protein
MVREPGDPGPEESARATEDAHDNRVEAERIAGDVVQARDVQGGIHLHLGQSTPAAFGVIPRQLPGDVQAFVNREREITELGTAIGARRDGTPGGAVALIITGSAGVGKTALALHWAHRNRHLFPDGEIYLNLRGYDPSQPLTPEVLLDRVLRDLGVPAHSIPDGLDGRAALYRSLLAVRRVLVVLDNAATVGQVRPLLPGTSEPLVMVTSRNRLPGLVVRDGARRVQLDIFGESESLTLLRTVIADRREDDPADLAELARLCAHLPLALRIAAERALSRPTMQLTELIADLRDDSFLWDALSAGNGTEGDAVRTVFAWSYRALPDDAATMFRMLGLHPGNDISLPAAAAVAGVGLRPARRALDILLGGFLIENIRPGRYQFHDLLRAYALDQGRHLDSQQVRVAAIDRVAGWYLHTVDAAVGLIAPNERFDLGEAAPDGVEPLAFRDQIEALNWFESERENLVAAVRSALAAGSPLRAWQLTMASSPIHMHHHTFDHWEAMAAIAVAAADSIGDRAALATALDNHGKVLFRRRMLGEALRNHSAALAIRRDLGDRRGVAGSLNALGLIGLRTRHLDDAAENFREAAAIFDEVGDRSWQGLARSNLAEASLEADDATAANETLGGILALFTGLGDRAYQGNTLWLISWARRSSGDLAAARSAIGQALAIAEDAGNRVWEAFWLIEAARVHIAAGAPDEALECCRTSASLHRQIGDRSREATALDCAGEAIRALGRPEEAAAFHLQAIRAHGDLGDTWQKAVALVHLADCLRELAREDDERRYLSEALVLLVAFPDRRAATLVEDITARVGPPPAPTT